MIPVKGLKTGKHQYSFDIDKEFFESYNKSEIKGADLKADVEMTVEVKTISLTVCFNGFIEVVCDRCLEYVQLPLHFSDKTCVEKGKSEESDNSEMIVIPENEHEIDLTQYLYECIMLSLPYQVVHQDDKEGNSTCNKAMIDKLNEHSADETVQKESDPRWDALKDLKTRK